MWKADPYTEREKDKERRRYERKKQLHMHRGLKIYIYREREREWGVFPFCQITISVSFAVKILTENTRETHVMLKIP